MSYDGYPKPMPVPIPQPIVAPKPPLHPLTWSSTLFQSVPGFKPHPSYKYFLIATIACFLMALLCFISVFVPWSWKDIAVGSRAYVYFFTTCIENPFSPVNQVTYLDPDFISSSPGAARVTGRDATCMGWILATIAMVFITFLTGFFLTLLMVLVIRRLWRVPLKLAYVVLCLLIFCFITVVLGWSFWLAFGENLCVPGSYWPINGYSYGFVQNIFATACSFVAIVAWWLGIRELQRFKKGQLKIKAKQGEMLREPVPPPMFPEPAFLDQTMVDQFGFPIMPMPMPSPATPFYP